MYTHNDELVVKCANLETHLCGLNDKAQKIVAAVDADSRDLTEGERTTLDGVLSEAAATERKITALNKEMEETKPIRRTSPRQPDAGHLPAARVSEVSGDGAPRVFDGRTKASQIFASAGHVPAENWRSFAEYARCVGYGLNDDRLERFRAAGQSEGVGDEGGFAVPIQYTYNLFDMALESEIVRPRAQVIGMTSASLSAPGFSYTDHGAGGHITPVQWLAERGEGTDRTAQVRSVNLAAKKAAIFSKATSEVLEDAPNFERSLVRKFAQDLAFGLDHAFIWGNGAGQPLGFMNSGSLITVSTSSAAGVIAYVDVLSMFARLHPAGYANAIWIAGPDCLPQLFNLQSIIRNDADSDNVGGGMAPVFQQTSDGTFRLLGRPVVVTEKTAALSTTGDLILADFSQYLIGLRRDMSMARSIAPGWQTDEVSFRLITRLDGQPVINEPVTLRDGSRTVSPFVVLATRS